MRVYIRIPGQQAGETAPYANVWAYWRESESGTETIHTLRTDNDGMFMKFSGNPDHDPAHSWEYTETFTEVISTATIFIAFSQGSKPLPVALLQNMPDFFVEYPVQEILEDEIQCIETDQTFTLTWPPPSVVQLPSSPGTVQISNPEPLSLWPLRWEEPTDAYYTDGLDQGNAALWAQINGGNYEYQPSAAPSAAIRPVETELPIEGDVPSQATGVRIQILDSQGTALQLKQNARETSTVTEIQGVLQPVSGTRRPFRASIFFNDASAHFGWVKIVIIPDGINPQQIFDIDVYLCGIQSTIVNDTESNANGQIAGPVHTGPDEVHVIDFNNSPQNSQNGITAQTRCRRMVTFCHHNRSRAYSATNATVVVRPEMPQWMAEFHIVGLDRTTLENFLLYRYNLCADNPTDFSIQISWQIELSWDGPDSGQADGYRYTASFPAGNAYQHTARFIYDASAGQLTNVTATGTITDGLAPAPQAPTFPVTNRRRASLWVANCRRVWGRQQGARQCNVLLIEWQPSIDNNNDEIIRGGDGQLRCTTALTGDSGTTHSYDIYIPRFRVRGENPGQRNDIIDAAVTEYFNNHATLQRVTALPLACWQETCRLLCGHETHFHQFDHRGSGRRKYGIYYGHESMMPIFGAPHGYGYGQIDAPPADDNIVWDYFENIKQSVRVVMHDKSMAAWNNELHSHVPNPVTQYFRAVYQREIVRRYNGGSEFNWSTANNRWEIDPSAAAVSNIQYCNNALGTSVQYYNASGNPNWPMVLTSANYGPGV